MKTKIFWTSLCVGAALFSLASWATASVSGKAEEVWDKTKQTSKKIGHEVAKETRKTVATVEHAIDKPDADAHKVNVTVTDSGIQMPQSLHSGKTAFVVRNAGKQKHDFEIEGEHLDRSFWFGVEPGGTKTMQVDLKPGTYEADRKVTSGQDSKVKLTVK